MSSLNKLAKFNLLKNNSKNFKINTSMANRFEPWFNNDYQTPTSHNRRLLHNNPTNVAPKENLGDIFIELKPGQEAPIGYIGKRHYPDWYKPYSTNIKGTGFLITMFVFGIAVCYMQYLIYLKKTGRDKLVNHRSEHEYVMDSLLTYRLRKEQSEMSDKNPIFKYVYRYAKESGW